MVRILFSPPAVAKAAAPPANSPALPANTLACLRLSSEPREDVSAVNSSRTGNWCKLINQFEMYNSLLNGRLRCKTFRFSPIPHKCPSFSKSSVSGPLHPFPSRAHLSKTMFLGANHLINLWLSINQTFLLWYQIPVRSNFSGVTWRRIVGWLRKPE